MTSWMNPKLKSRSLGDGEGDGREVQDGGDICTPMADSC